jgi:hypothetical protein
LKNAIFGPRTLRRTWGTRPTLDDYFGNGSFLARDLQFGGPFLHAIPLDLGLAFDDQELIEDLLHDLLRRSICGHAHEVGRDFKGV